MPYPFLLLGNAMTKSAPLLICLCFLASLTNSFAHDHEAGPLNSEMFFLGDYDSNHDGNISLEEYLAGDSANTEKIYHHLDANGDGILDSEEQLEIQAIYKMMQEQVKSKTRKI